MFVVIVVVAMVIALVMIIFSEASDRMSAAGSSSIVVIRCMHGHIWLLILRLCHLNRSLSRSMVVNYWMVDDHIMVMVIIITAFAVT